MTVTDGDEREAELFGASRDIQQEASWRRTQVRVWKTNAEVHAVEKWIDRLQPLATNGDFSRPSNWLAGV